MHAHMTHSCSCQSTFRPPFLCGCDTRRLCWLHPEGDSRAEYRVEPCIAAVTFPAADIIRATAEDAAAAVGRQKQQRASCLTSVAAMAARGKASMHPRCSGHKGSGGSRVASSLGPDLNNAPVCPGARKCKSEQVVRRCLCQLLASSVCPPFSSWSRILPH